MTVRIGVVGPGGMGRAHIDRITGELAGGAVVAVHDIDEVNARRVAEPIGAKVFGSATELVASDAVDAVLVASDGTAHLEPVLAAVAAGKPVLCEKPLAPTAAECEQVMAAEVAAGRRLVTVGFMRRFDASYLAMKAVLDGGELGEALLVHCRHRNPSAREAYRATMAITDTAIHEIDAMRWLLGEEIARVRVDVGKSTRNRFGHQIDPLTLLLETISGVRVDVEVFVNARYGYDVQCELVLETGVVSLGDQSVVSRRDASGARHRITSDHNDRFHAAFNAEVQHWISAVAAGGGAAGDGAGGAASASASTAWDGYAAAVVCDAGVRSLAAVLGGEDDGAGRVDAGGWVPVSLAQRPALYA